MASLELLQTTKEACQLVTHLTRGSRLNLLEHRALVLPLTSVRGQTFYTRSRLAYSRKGLTKFRAVKAVSSIILVPLFSIHCKKTDGLACCVSEPSSVVVIVIDA